MDAEKVVDNVSLSNELVKKTKVGGDTKKKTQRRVPVSIPITKITGKENLIKKTNRLRSRMHKLPIELPPQRATHKLQPRVRPKPNKEDKAMQTEQTLNFDTSEISLISYIREKKISPMKVIKAYQHNEIEQNVSPVVPTPVEKQNIDKNKQEQANAIKKIIQEFSDSSKKQLISYGLCAAKVYAQKHYQPSIKTNYNSNLNETALVPETAGRPTPTQKHNETESNEEDKMRLQVERCVMNTLRSLVRAGTNELDGETVAAQFSHSDDPLAQAQEHFSPLAPTSKRPRITLTLKTSSAATYAEHSCNQETWPTSSIQPMSSLSYNPYETVTKENYPAAVPAAEPNNFQFSVPYQLDSQGPHFINTQTELLQHPEFDYQRSQELRIQEYRRMQEVKRMQDYQKAQQQQLMMAQGNSSNYPNTQWSHQPFTASHSASPEWLHNKSFQCDCKEHCLGACQYKY